MWCVAPIVCQHNFLQTNFKGTNKILVFMTPSIFLPSILCLKRQNEHDNSNDLALEWRKRNADDTLLWRKSLITSMYSFSKQGKHFNKLITISKQRSGWVKAKTFMLWTTVVELGMHDLWVKHVHNTKFNIMIRQGDFDCLFEKRVLDPSRILKWQGRWYLKSCSTKQKSCAANVVSEVVNTM